MREIWWISDGLYAVTIRPRYGHYTVTIHPRYCQNAAANRPLPLRREPVFCISRLVISWLLTGTSMVVSSVLLILTGLTFCCGH